MKHSPYDRQLPLRPVSWPVGSESLQTVAGAERAQLCESRHLVAPESQGFARPDAPARPWEVGVMNHYRNDRQSPLAPFPGQPSVKLSAICHRREMLWQRLLRHLKLSPTLTQ
jgi:hypothetical protein